MKSLGIRRLNEAKTERLFWEWLPPEIRVRQATNDADAEILASLDEAKRHEWDERVRRLTTASINLARDHGIPILLITQARSEGDKQAAGHLNDGGLDRLAESLAGPGVYHLSMKQVFEQRKDPASLFADSAHLRREGHTILAAAILEKLRQENLIKPNRITR
jgi:lysophospholipase L1-like esterase